MLENGFISAHIFIIKKNSILDIINFKTNDLYYFFIELVFKFFYICCNSAVWSNIGDLLLQSMYGLVAESNDICHSDPVSDSRHIHLAN